MVDQETGMRGFLATWKENYLEPYNNGKIEFKSLMEYLLATVSDNPQQVELLKEIDVLASSWDSHAASKYISIRKEINKFDEYNGEVLQRINNGVGKKKMDKLRETISQFSNNNLKNRLTLDLVNMETGLRGFLVTGNEMFLEPYNARFKT